MEKTIDLAVIKQKLYERLSPSGWGSRLKSFLLSEEMDKILGKLYEESQDGKRFTPVLKQVFRAFEECPYGELKVVMLGQDAYPQLGVADGIAFSCSNTGVLQPSLKYILQEVHSTVYGMDKSYDYNPDLKHWANQGVLLINTAFTTSTGRVGAHYLIWKPFLTFVLDIISSYNPGMIYVFLGKESQKYADLIPDNTYKIMVSHPASAAYANAKTWDSEDVFNKINNLLRVNNNLKITW